MFYSTKLMNFWHKNLHFVHNPSKLFKKGAAPKYQPYSTLRLFRTILYMPSLRQQNR